MSEFCDAIKEQLLKEIWDQACRQVRDQIEEEA